MSTIGPNIQLLLSNYGQDLDQDDDDYSKYYESSMLDQANPDDLLSPMEKLRKYCTSENIFNRQMVARSIMEAVQTIQNTQECLSLLEIITKLADDFEPSVRCELMEQLPPFSLMIMDMRLVPDAISGFLLPIMVKYLADTNNQVRKLSQNALLQLIDQGMIHRDDVEQQICPVLLTLTEPDSGDDFRTEAVAVITRITPLIGSEAAERSFLKRFGELCADPLFHVRKVCASNFGDMASVLNQETIEEHLLPLFAKLCEDGVWGVRKSCAETFMAVSGTCSRKVRYERLSPLFVSLLCDKSRWVQMAAYQALGHFIATFADPERSGFDVDEDGNLVRVQRINAASSIASDDMPMLEDPSLESDRQTEGQATTEEWTSMKTENGGVDKDFNNFEYWRTPLPDVEVLDDLDTLSDEKEKDTTDTNTNENSVDGFEDVALDDHDARSNAVSPRPAVSSDSADFIHVEDPAGHGFHSDSEDEDENSQQHSASTYASSLLDEERLRKQSIVPPALLEHYISMTEPCKAQSIDVELPRHCAFTLPGVVLALGPENWSLLKDTYELLSTDMQWKIRRTLAFSIHDLAVILGEEICVKDLVPIFNGFLKDLDEVRVGLLKHLFDFISILPLDLQKSYLQLFAEFQKTDNVRNWRFRQDLALQLMNLTSIYTEEEIAEYLCPIALDLACDKVAEVRQNAFHLLCILMRKLYHDEERQHYLQKFVVNIVTLATHHQHWVKRKACAQICFHFLEDGWYDATHFATDFLPSLVNLSSDGVPNVRLIAAKAMLAFMRTEYFQSLPEDDEVRKCVDRTVESLQLDTDRDVRFFSGGKVNDRRSTGLRFNDTTEVDFDENSSCTSEPLEDESFRMFQKEERQHMMQHGLFEGEVRIIDRGIHDFSLEDNEEGVYQHTLGDDDDDGDVVIEEYYIEDPNSGNLSGEEYLNMDGSNAQVYVEEIVEEIIETVQSGSAEKKEKDHDEKENEGK